MGPLSSVCHSVLFGLMFCWMFTFSESKPKSRKLENDFCDAETYSYEFTECDASGGRWRVAVPPLGCDGVAYKVPPKRLNDCYTSCEAGQFLNLTSLQCEVCDIGTYSLGGGVRFEDWTKVPQGFHATEEMFLSVFNSRGRKSLTANCSTWGWKPKGEVILSQGGPCLSTLSYSALLVKPGFLNFTYQYADDSILFEFQANSDQCETLVEAEGSRWPSQTGEGIWKVEQIPLKTGLNMLQWKTMGTEPRRSKPVLIKQIEIDGVGYASSCNPCAPGTYAERPGSHRCSKCPKNTYSGHRAGECTPCSRTDTEYAEEGSAKCILRPPCTSSDYYQFSTKCDERNLTQKRYTWVDNKICLDSHPDSVQLPPDGAWLPCPPCNPGSEYRNGQCSNCPENYYSDGRSACSSCPPGTIGNTGHHLTQWYMIPQNMRTFCVSQTIYSEDSGCTSAPPWHLDGDSIRSSKAHAEWVYLVMTLAVSGFRSKGGNVNGKLLEIGQITFDFEMHCRNDCELIFMQGTGSRNASVVQQWVGYQKKQTFTLSIVRNDSYTFTWAFQKLAWDAVRADTIFIRHNEADRDMTDADNYVLINAIHVTNSIDGGADHCIECKDGLVYSTGSPRNGGTPSCVTCGPGKYRVNTTRRLASNDSKNATEEVSSVCKPCPPGTVTVDEFAANESACHPCGPGMISKDGLTCTTDCVVQIGHRTYDLRPLKGFKTVKGTRLFTTSGTQYYHVFNISLCMEQNAACYKNVSMQRGFETQTTKVESLICQSNIFPPTNADLKQGDDASDKYGWLQSQPLSTHASSLGDHLIGITHSPKYMGIDIQEAIGSPMDHPGQFHFFYAASERTPACPYGRNTSITFRCRMTANGWAGIDTSSDHHHKSEGNADGIKVPDNCPAGTCDGCNYHFIWDTEYACPLCTESELKVVRGECKDGTQEIHYLPTEFSQCLLKYNASWPTAQKCQSQLPVVTQIVVEVAITLAISLSVTLICFWRRHRKLEYKYMKLVASGGSGTHGDGRDSADDPMTSDKSILPFAESCALDDDEGEDVEYEAGARSGSSGGHQVGFLGNTGLKSFVSRMDVFSKLRSMTRSREEGTSLEIMNLTDDKEAMT